MEQAVQQIKLAMANSLSMNQQLRNEAQEFITKQCEPIPQYQQVLLHIIASYNRQTAQSTQNDQMMQYQAILFMKNSLTRLLQMHRKNKRYQRGNLATNGGTSTSGLSQSLSMTLNNLQGMPQAINQQHQLTSEFLEDLKAKILSLIQNPDDCILGENAYNQLTLVACIFVKQDFPSNWPQLNQWLLSTFDQLFANINSLQTEDAPKIQRFLNFYFQVLKEQNKKKLSTQKGHFNKVARDHLKNVLKVWEFFNQQQTRMIYDVENDVLQLQNYNKILFEISAKLDKCLMLVIACGFSLNDLLHEPVDNQYVQVLKQILKKLKFFIGCIEQLSKFDLKDSKTQEFHEIFENQIKSLLKHLNDLQVSEALLFHKSLGEYIHTIAQIIFRGELHITRVKKLAIFSMYSIVTTTIYNQGNQDQQSNNRDGRIGLLISPMKFKNFEPQLEEAAAQYRQMLEMPDPNSKDVKEQQRHDGARQLIQLLFQNYLPLQTIDQWRYEPENFIENEDENYLMLEYDMDPEMTISLLSFQLIDKLIEKFYSTTFPFIQNQLLQQYFTGELKLENELQEDALLSIVCMLGKIHKDNKTPKEQQLDVCYVLDLIKQSKWDNILFQRRYVHILIQWVKLLPKAKFIHYFEQILANLATTTDFVLIYEHCSCIHEMLKEIDYWLKMSASSNKGGSSGSILTSAFGDTIKKVDNQNTRRTKNFDIINFNEGDTQDDQIQMSNHIHSTMIDYLKTFQIVCNKLSGLFNTFNAPTLVWKMVNYLSFILEKNTESTEHLIECLKELNMNKLLQLNSEQVHDALIDMLKQLLAHQPNSSIILEMCISLLDHCLTKTQHLDEALTFWVYTMRVTSLDNPAKIQLKNLFMKFCVSYGSVNKEHLFIEFLKVAQECALINAFNTQQEIQQVIEFAFQKFQYEVDYENKKREEAKKQRSHSTSGGESSGDNEGDSDFTDESSMYEKKLNILHIPHIILWKMINSGDLKLQDITLVGQDAVNFLLESQKKFILLCTCYLIQNKDQKSSPGRLEHSFTTTLITYINRIIIVNNEWFLTQILAVLHQTQGIQFGQFLQSWIQKMDFITSRESQRINLIAIYTMLPKFSQDMIAKFFGEIGRLTFSELDSFMYLKQTNSVSRFHSPSKMSNECTFPYGGTGALQQKNIRLGIQYSEKMSQRLEALKKEDPILTQDLIEVFNQNLQLLINNLNMPNAEVLVEFLPNTQDHLSQQLRKQYVALIYNKCTK